MKPQEIIQIIHKYRIAVRTEKNPDVLAQAIVELSTYNSELGELVADLERDASEAKLEAEIEEAKTKTELIKEAKISIAQSGEQAKIETYHLKRSYIDKYHLYKQVRNVWEDTRNLVSAAQSRLSYLKYERA